MKVLVKTYLVFFVSFLVVGCYKNEQNILNPDIISKIKPGVYTEKPPGIGAINGSCVGKIALTPVDTRSSLNYPFIYDCQTKKFEILLVPGNTDAYKSTLGDLSFTENGYYLHQSITVDLKRVGRYIVVNNKGDLLSEIRYPDLDAHDLILDDKNFTFIKYIPDRNNSKCFTSEGAPVQLGISQKDFNGNALFDWVSDNEFNTNWKVSKAEKINKDKEDEWKKYFRPIRSCYTSVLLKLKSFETPALFVREGKWPLLQLEENDYIHANSIQRINAYGDILVSARHLDTVFIINRETGKVSWSLGGPYSKMSQNNPVGDPLKGFSHQHSANLMGDTLYLFDNRNNFPKDASRIVAYKVDPLNPNKAIFKYHFLEPNGKRRPAMGYVSKLENDKLIIGWGAVLEQDQNSEQRAVSIVNPKSDEEEFFINLLPGWQSYRAKSSIEIKKTH